MQVKPGDIVFYEPDDLNDIESEEEARSIDTACVVIELSDGRMSYVRLRGNSLSGMNEYSTGVFAQPTDFSIGWHRTQADAIKAGFEAEHARYSAWLQDLEAARKFLFPSA